MEDMYHLDRQSMLTCPDCNGVMWEIDEASSSAFRCHVGHAAAIRRMNDLKTDGEAGATQ